ncbi:MULTISPECIES: hypothetical protein [Pseudobacillus]|uniref:hypothetical protein n=1 Tax=Pseudobacillus TaxID=108525 RepID=UPI00387955A5
MSYGVTRTELLDIRMNSGTVYVQTASYLIDSYVTPPDYSVHVEWGTLYRGVKDRETIEFLENHKGFRAFVEEQLLFHLMPPSIKKEEKMEVFLDSIADDPFFISSRAKPTNALYSLQEPVKKRGVV